MKLNDEERALVIAGLDGLMDKLEPKIGEVPDAGRSYRLAEELIDRIRRES